MSTVDPARTTANPGLEDDPDDELASPFRRWVALGVTLVALLGGIVGYLASDAGARESATEREAEVASVAALSAQNGAAADAYEQFGDYVTALSLKRRHDIEVVGGQVLGQDAVPGTVQDWQAAGAKVADLTPLLRPGAMADRPDLLWNQLFVAPNLAALRQQAAQQTAGSWGDKSNLYVGGVTLLAVAVTLLGLSLTVGTRVRRIFVWPAGLLAAVTLLGSAVVAVIPPARTPGAAIDAVAEGDRLAGNRDFDGATAAYARAIALDPDYAAAYARRGLSELLAGSPQRNTSMFVVTTATPAARQASIVDLNRSLQLGGSDYTTLVNQGANYFHVPDYRRSEDFSRRAIALNPDLPLPWLNLTLALVGEGREAEARATMAPAIDRIKSRPTLQERGELYAAARSTLVTAAIQTPAAEPLSLSLQAQLVRAEGDQVVPKAVPAPDAGAHDLQLTVLGSTVRAQVAYSGLTQGTRVAWMVYYRTSATQEWTQRADLSLYETPQLPTSGTAYKNVFDLGCPTGGEYRVDLYVDGRRLATATSAHPQTALALTPFTDAVGGINVCRPAGWTLTADLTGSTTLASPDGSRHLTVRTVPTVRPPATDAARTELVDQVLDRLQTELGPQATVTRTAQDSFFPLVGTARLLHIDGTVDGYVWAVVGTDNVVRTVSASYPTGAPGDLGDVSSRIRFA
jgi:tetratricopeptide (TPR) repeat protein